MPGRRGRLALLALSGECGWGGDGGDAIPQEEDLPLPAGTNGVHYVLKPRLGRLASSQASPSRGLGARSTGRLVIG